MGNSKYSESLMSQVERNQLRYSSAILILLFATHLMIPSSHEYTEPFFKPQYKVGPDQYDIGSKDAYMVLYWIVVLTFLRSFTMQCLWMPLAKLLLPPNSNQHLRFAEQSWAALAPVISFSYSFYVYYNSEYFLNLDNVYVGWPHTKIPAVVKIYYLLELGFWFQQFFVLHVEKRRKDHYQMFTHHILTCVLVGGSYYYYFTRVGNIILLLMDPVDFILCFAKVLRYIGFTTLCDVLFLMFLGSWVVLRHGFYNYVLYHGITKSRLLMPEATRCVEGVFQQRCWTSGLLDGFYGLLAGLQIIQIVWLYFIIRVAIKVITGGRAEDVRSDSEDESDTEDVEEDDEQHEQKPDHKHKHQDKKENEEEEIIESDETIGNGDENELLNEKSS